MASIGAIAILGQVATVLVALLAVSAPIRGETVEILRNGDVSSWKERRFAGNTVYEAVHIDGQTVLRASSAGHASGLFRKIRVDIRKTPILDWTWRVCEALGPVDERTRNGDDYAARVYVIHSRPLLFWRTRALNYVWSGSAPRGATWPNAYTRSVRMIALRSGNGEAGRWVSERRDVRADFGRFLGRTIRFIDAVALMTDTDDGGGRAVAHYGDIRFTSE